MEELSLLGLFRWGKAAIAVAFVTDMLFFHDATTKFVVGLMHDYGVKVAERFERALKPVFAHPEVSGNTPDGRRSGQHPARTRG
jgi:hypothetical protein